MPYRSDYKELIRMVRQLREALELTRSPNFKFLIFSPPGVIIHFHDILWPFEYPKKWLEAGRAWNEAYLLLAISAVQFSI